MYSDQYGYILCKKKRNFFLLFNGGLVVVGVHVSIDGRLMQTEEGFYVCEVDSV